MTGLCFNDTCLTCCAYSREYALDRHAILRANVDKIGNDGPSRCEFFRKFFLRGARMLMTTEDKELIASQVDGGYSYNFLLRSKLGDIVVDTMKRADIFQRSIKLGYGMFKSVSLIDAVSADGKTNDDLINTFVYHHIDNHHKLKDLVRFMSIYGFHSCVGMIGNGVADESYFDIDGYTVTVVNSGLCGYIYMITKIHSCISDSSYVVQRGNMLQVHTRPADRLVFHRSVSTLQGKFYFDFKARIVGFDYQSERYYDRGFQMLDELLSDSFVAPVAQSVKLLLIDEDFDAADDFVDASLDLLRSVNIYAYLYLADSGRFESLIDQYEKFIVLLSGHVKTAITHFRDDDDDKFKSINTVVVVIDRIYGVCNATKDKGVKNIKVIYDDFSASIYAHMLKLIGKNSDYDAIATIIDGDADDPDYYLLLLKLLLLLSHEARVKIFDGDVLKDHLSRYIDKFNDINVFSDLFSLLMSTKSTLQQSSEFIAPYRYLLLVQPSYRVRVLIANQFKPVDEISLASDYQLWIDKFSREYGCYLIDGFDLNVDRVFPPPVDGASGYIINLFRNYQLSAIASDSIYLADNYKSITYSNYGLFR